MTLAILSIKYLGTGCIFLYPYDTNTRDKIASGLSQLQHITEQDFCKYKSNSEYKTTKI